MFNLAVYQKGKVLQAEGMAARNATIILWGEVMTYRRFLKYESKNNDEKDLEQFILHQNQGLPHLCDSSQISSLDYRSFA